MLFLTFISCPLLTFIARPIHLLLLSLLRAYKFKIDGTKPILTILLYEHLFIILVMQIQVLSRLSDKELKEEMAAIQKAIKEHDS